MHAASLVIGFCLIGATDAELVERAGEATRAGLAESDASKARPHFKEAMRTYEELVDSGNRSPALFSNLGNSAMLAGDVPRAIFAYRRGLQLAPGNIDMHLNLAYARQQVDYASPDQFARPPVENRPPWLPHLSPRFCFWSATLLYLAAWLCFVLWQIMGRKRLATAGVILLIVCGLLIASAYWDSTVAQEDLRQPIVVIARDDVSMHKGNGKSYPLSHETPLNKGAEARLQFERAGWLRIQLSGGEIGWVPRTAVLVSD